MFFINDKKEKIAVTNNSDKNIVSGQSISRNEFGISGGIFWSPKSSFLAFYQKDETDVIKKYLKASNLTWDGVKDIDNEMWFSKNDLKKLKLEIGDLLVAEGGDVGKSCIFDSNEEFYYQNSVNRVRGQKNNANKFLYYWLFTLKYSGYIDILCNKSTIAHFTAEKLNETILLLPDSVEQNEIIAYLERENGKINQLILKQQSLIEKLKEYRASIISHAVTGKIDVMEFGA